MENIELHRLWTFTDWTTSIQTTRGSVELAQTYPYALIGSHPNCQIHLDDPTLPDVAVLICVLGTRFELVPLTASETLPQGNLEPGEAWNLGRYELELGFAGEKPERSDSTSDFGSKQSVSIFAGKRSWEASLSQAVTLIGSDTPSLLKLRSVGVRRCQGAIICVEDHVWYLSLSPDDHAGKSSFCVYDLAESAVTIGSAELRWVAGRTKSSQEIVDTQTGIGSTLLESPEVLETNSEKKHRTISAAADPDEFTQHITGRLTTLGMRRGFWRRFLWILLLCVIVSASFFAIHRIWLEVYNGDGVLTELLKQLFPKAE